jgi:mono/diheme cytochrome c family protein
VAGTLPPTTGGPAPALSTIPVEDTRPGEGKMPAWPLVLSGVGFAGAASILGWHWLHTRPR